MKTFKFRTLTKIQAIMANSLRKGDVIEVLYSPKRTVFRFVKSRTKLNFEDFELLTCLGILEDAAYSEVECNKSKRYYYKITKWWKKNKFVSIK